MGDSLLDRTLVNITSIVITGISLAVILWRIDIPSANRTFYGENHFALKRDVMEEAQERWFAVPAALGIILQLVVEVFGERLPQRLHTSGLYAAFTVAFFLVGFPLAKAINKYALRWARRRWEPRVLTGQAEAMRQMASVAANDWIAEEYRTESAGWSTEAVARHRLATQGWALEGVERIEELLGVAPAGQLPERVARLDGFFRTRLPAADYPGKLPAEGVSTPLGPRASP